MEFMGYIGVLIFIFIGMFIVFHLCHDVYKEKITVYFKQIPFISIVFFILSFLCFALCLLLFLLLISEAKNISSELIFKTIGFLFFMICFLSGAAYYFGEIRRVTNCLEELCSQRNSIDDENNR
jgi:Ni/Fe-hydrogenase subunit HybB-like protein